MRSTCQPEPGFARNAVQRPRCRKVIVVSRRNVTELANPKVRQVVVNMDALEEELAPHVSGVDIAFAAFGVGKGSAKMSASLQLFLDALHSTNSRRAPLV